MLPLGNRSTLFFFSGRTRDDVLWYRWAVRCAFSLHRSMQVHQCANLRHSPVFLLSSCYVALTIHSDAAVACARRW